MDDPTKQQNNTQGTPVDQQVLQQQSAPSKPVVAPPLQPVSGPHKEMAPLSGMTTELMKPSEQAPELPSELVEAGVEVTPNNELPVIPREVQLVGVKQVNENTILHIESQGAVTLPQMTMQQAVEIKKSASVKDAAKWFAIFVMRQFDKIAYQKMVTKQ